MCTLLVLSKFLPEYSGAALRTKLLYDKISISLESSHINVICGSTEEFVPSLSFDGKYKILRLPSYFFGHIRVLRIISQFILSLLYTTLLFYSVYKARRVHIIGNDTVTSSVLLLAKILRKKVLYEAVTQNASNYQRWGGIFKLYIPKSATVIAISSAIKDRIVTEGFCGEIWLRPNPIVLANFQRKTYSQKIKFKKQFCIKAEHKLCMFIGKFIPNKGQILLLQTLARLPENYHLILAGPVSKTGIHAIRDQHYLDQLFALVEFLNLGDRVKIVTEFVNAGDYIPYADYFLNFSKSEGLGNTVLEAVVAGVTVIANDRVPSFCEHLENLSASYVLRLDPEIIANQIISCESCKQIQQDRERDIKYMSDKVSHTAIYEKYKQILEL